MALSFYYDKTAKKKSLAFRTFEQTEFAKAPKQLIRLTSIIDLLSTGCK